MRAETQLASWHPGLQISTALCLHGASSADCSHLKQPASLVKKFTGCKHQATAMHANCEYGWPLQVKAVSTASATSQPATNGARVDAHPVCPSAGLSVADRRGTSGHERAPVISGSAERKSMSTRDSLAAPQRAQRMLTPSPLTPRHAPTPQDRRSTGGSRRSVVAESSEAVAA